MQDNLDILTQAIRDWIPEDRPVSQAPPARELEQRLDLSLGDEGAGEEALKQAIRDYLHYNPDVSKAGFFKLLYSGLNKRALLGDWITALSNATMHTYQVSPVATLMELELIDQWCKLIGFEGGEGVMVSGGSQANLIGMMLGRYHACPEFKTKGLDGRTLVAYVSDQAHFSSEKAVNVLGIGSNNLIKVATDEAGRMIPEALEQEIKSSLDKGHTPFYIGLTAGTTVVGAYDPVAETSAIAKKYNLWLHIDGAWGGPILFSEQHKHLLANSHLADSFTWDAHKVMNVPLTAGVILVNHKGMLKDCCSGGGTDYLYHADENADYNLGERSIQCGRRADALKVWLSWKAEGSKGFEDKIDHLQSVKQDFVELVEQQDNLEMLAPAAYFNVLFQYRPEHISDEDQLRDLNIAICAEMRRSGSAYVDYARFKDRTGIRLILANPNQTHEQLEQLVANIKQVGKQLSAE